MLVDVALKEEGFTLIELMICVGIAGILASVGVNEFDHYASAARQSEAKLNLAGAYMAELSFGVENNSYTFCLVQAGFQGEAVKRYYYVGFRATGESAAAQSSCGPDGASSCMFYSFQAPGTSCTCNAANNSYNGNTTLGNDCGTVATVATAPNVAVTLANKDAMLPAGLWAVSQNTFTVGAAGGLSPVPGLYDVWTIDNTSALINVNQGM